MVYSTRRFVLVLVLSGVILFLCFLVLWALRLTRYGKRELILVLFVRLFDLGRAAACDFGTPWTFLLPFFFNYIKVGFKGVKIIWARFREKKKTTNKNAIITGSKMYLFKIEPIVGLGRGWGWGWGVQHSASKKSKKVLVSVVIFLIYFAVLSLDFKLKQSLES